MKKYLMLLLTILLILGLSACQGLEISEGDFIYQRSGSMLSITGLTEEGQTKTHLIFPNQHEDRYVQLGSQILMWITEGRIESDQAKRIYNLNEIKPVIELSHEGLPNLEKIFLFYLNELPADFDGSDHFQGIFGSAANQYFYANDKMSFYANVSYLYHYDDAPNKGYYWIDDYDDELISFIPEDPTRDGYSFGGWYKDELCTMKWNFDLDRIPEKIYLGDQYQFVETKLYAKWI